MNKEIINDQKNTIHRLQQECTEKTNVIIALGEQLKRKEQECEELKKQCELEKEMCTSWCDESYKDKEENIKLKEEIDNLKQYKRSKQAIYEALQKKCNELELKNRKLKAENDTLFKAIEEVNKINKRLESENKELKKCYKNNSALLDFEETNTTKLVNRVMKLEQILTEIKIFVMQAKHDYNLPKYLFDTILQKISEVFD